MKNDAFYHEFVVTLKDVNMYGTVYFSRYFEWHGVARELYFASVDNFRSILQGTALITRRAWNDYTKHIHVFDQIVVKVQNRNIKKCSFEMMFTLIDKNTGEVVATGGQTLCFADAATGQILQVPAPLLKKVNGHLYQAS